MRDLSILSDLAAAEIDTLRAAGVEPTPEEVVRINWLSWQVETPGQRMELARGIPVRIGSAVLWPLTLHAEAWFQRVGLSLPIKHQEAALGYAMAFGRSEGNELDVDGRAALPAVLEWRQRLRCTRAEFSEALAQITQQSEVDAQPPASDDVAGMTHGDLSVFLTAHCGGPAVAWERLCSAPYALAMLRAVVCQQRAESGVSVLDEARSDANRALGLALEEITRAHGKGPADG